MELAERGIEVQKARLAAAPEAEIACFESRFALSVPEDVRAFWRRGLAHGSASFERGPRSAFLGFDFCSIKAAGRSLETLRSLARDVDDDDGPALLDSIPITWSEPQLLVDGSTGSVSHWSVRNPWRGPIAKSLREYLEHWLASGCFGSHDAALAREGLVAAGMRVSRASTKNLWLRYYDAQFPKLRRRT